MAGLPDHLDVHLIRILYMLLSEKNVSRVALKLNQPQPSISASLRKLQNYSADFGGLEVAPLREEMGAWLLVLAAEEQRPYPPIPQVRRLLPPE